MITWNCRITINLGRSFSTSGLRTITNSSPTGIVHDRINACDHWIFLTILQPRSIPKVVFVPITTTNFERLVHSEKLSFSQELTQNFVYLSCVTFVSQSARFFHSIYGSIFQLIFLGKSKHYLTRGMTKNGHFPTWKNRAPLLSRCAVFLHKNRSKWVPFEF